ncbi:Arabinose efflux permease [Thermoplasmatales archaeon BRNA1]|nr:Arabinose efflux permease [Thermoplasmatales archaeon BRNA1]
MNPFGDPMECALDKRHLTMLFAVMLFATFMDGLDGTIVNVAAPDIGMDLGVDTATVSWIVIVYMVVLAGTLVAFARISADIGVRKVMAAGIFIFIAGSALCGLSDSFAMLVTFRAVQAIGAAMMGATAPQCCTEYLPLNKLGFGLSIVSIGGSAGFAVGPFIGGAIVEFFDWHWCFLINIPIGLVAAPLVLRALPPRKESGRIRLDYRGAVTLCGAIASGTLAIETVSYPDLRLLTAVCAVLFFVMLALFIAAERRTDRPLLNIRMFAKPDFTAIFLCLMMMNAAYMGMLYLLPFFGEKCLDMTSLTVGAFMMISGMAIVVFGMPIGKWSDRKGRRLFSACAGISMLIADVILIVLNRDISWAVFAVAMFFMGFCWTFVGGPMASRLVEHAGEDQDMASSLTNEGYYIGASVGTAVIVAVFTFASGSGGVDIADVSASVFNDGFVPSAAVCAGMAILVTVLSLIVRDRNA